MGPGGLWDEDGDLTGVRGFDAVDLVCVSEGVDHVEAIVGAADDGFAACVEDAVAVGDDGLEEVAVGGELEDASAVDLFPDRDVAGGVGAHAHGHGKGLAVIGALKPTPANDQVSPTTLYNRMRLLSASLSRTVAAKS